MTPEHSLCSILRLILLAWDQNTFCVWIWPENPFLVFYYGHLQFDASFFHPDTPNTKNKPEHPKSPSKEHLLCSDDTRTPFVFHFETYTSSMTLEHPLCSDLTWTPFFNFLLWKLAFWCFVFSPGHPEHPEHTRTPKIFFHRTPFVFWWHKNTLCVPFWNLYF